MMSYSRTLVIKTKMKDLAVVEEAVDEVAEKMSWPDKLTNQIQLMLEELIVNVIHYGHEKEADASYDIHISLAAQADKVVLEIMDDGKPFNPLQDGPQVDTHSDIDHRKIGGLGIHLVRKLAQDVQYCRERGMNKLTVVKKVESDA